MQVRRCARAGVRTWLCTDCAGLRPRGSRRGGASAQCGVAAEVGTPAAYARAATALRHELDVLSSLAPAAAAAAAAVGVTSAVDAAISPAAAVAGVTERYVSAAARAWGDAGQATVDSAATADLRRSALVDACRAAILVAPRCAQAAEVLLDIGWDAAPAAERGAWFAASESCPAALGRRAVEAANAGNVREGAEMLLSVVGASVPAWAAAVLVRLCGQLARTSSAPRGDRVRFASAGLEAHARLDLARAPSWSVCGDAVGEACAVALAAGDCAALLGQWSVACAALDAAAARWGAVVTAAEGAANCAVATLLAASVEARIGGAAAAASPGTVATLIDGVCDELLRVARGRVSSASCAGGVGPCSGFAWSLAGADVRSVAAGLDAAAGQLAFVRGDLSAARVGGCAIVLTWNLRVR